MRKISGFAMWIMALWLVAACESATPAPTAPSAPSPSPIIVTFSPDESGLVPTRTPTPTITPSLTPRSEPTPTITPALTPTTPTSIPLRSPYPLLPTPTTTVSKQRLNYVPNCKAREKWMQCTDELVRIAFEYPSEWGTVAGYLREGSYQGYQYTYQFSQAQDRVWAGGLTRDYSSGRSSFFTDFRGTKNERDPVCSFWRAQNCQAVKEHVTRLVWYVDEIDYFCLHYPLGTTRMGIAIDLPPTARVNGFIFVGNFLSTQLDAETRDRALKLNPCDQNQVQPSLEIKQFAIEMQKRIESGDVDTETLQNLADLNHLAESIKFQ